MTDPTTRPPRLPALRPTVELLVGANGEPMLFDAERRTYVRLTPAAARVVALLDGRRTAPELAERLAGASGRAEVEEPLGRLVAELARAGVLDAPPAPRRGRAGRLDALARRRMPRLVLARSLDPVVGPAAAALDRVPARLRLTLVVLLAFGALAAVGAVSVVHGLPARQPVWPLLALVLVLIACHELAHAVVCRHLGVPVRGAGIAFWAGVLPVAYVDTTDAYRLRRRRDRAAIALAGPFNDLIWAGTSAAVVLMAGGAAGETAHVLMVLQLIMLLSNLNPLLPSDGLRAVEAAMGELNLRHRAFRYVAHRLLRVAPPSGLAALGARRRRLYVGYVLVATGYVAATLGLLAVSAGRLALGAVG